MVTVPEEAPGSSDLRDRIAGTLLGLAAGDALGAGYEFEVPPRRGAAAMIGGGLGGWAPGEWTDDTQLAVCVARVAAAGELRPDAVGDAFCDWYRSGPADVGIQTRAVLDGASGGADLPARAVGYVAAHPDRSAGNGSLMRTAPVALAHLGDDAALAGSARLVSALTHADPLAQDACVLWCVAIDRAIRQGRLDGVSEGLALLPDDRASAWRERIVAAAEAPPRSFTPNGYVVTAFQAALAAIWQTPVPPSDPAGHLREALQTAVAVGDDTDTVAAIAGALLGARWGATAVPGHWRDLLHGWPGYRAGDLERLALRAARAARAAE